MQDLPHDQQMQITGVVVPSGDAQLGRTIASADAVNTVALLVTNDRGTWLLKRPQELAPSEFPELITLARAGRLTELYRRSRIQIADHRTAPPLDPKHNFPINRWSLYAPGTTYFLPIIETTALTLNALLELFSPAMAVFVRDERAWFRAAGLGRFARSRGGHLHDNPRELRCATIQAVESALLDSMATEQGMCLQNLGLMTEALGLGGFPNFARHENAWFHALDFRMGSMPASRYAGAARLLTTVAGWLGQDLPFSFPLGLEREGQVLLKSFCPPYYATMEHAVRAFVETKFGAGGTYRGGAAQSAWSNPAMAQVPAPDVDSVRATIAYCEYVHRRYGRFPAYTAPFRTVIGFQVCRVDPEFYDQFYHPDALTEAMRANALGALGRQSNSPATP
jgi:hypothetical protein